MACVTRENFELICEVADVPFSMATFEHQSLVERDAFRKASESVRNSSVTPSRFALTESGGDTPF
jgi:hypothetical protein